MADPIEDFFVYLVPASKFQVVSIQSLGGNRGITVGPAPAGQADPLPNVQNGAHFCMDRDTNGHLSVPAWTVFEVLRLSATRDQLIVKWGHPELVGTLPLGAVHAIVEVSRKEAAQFGKDLDNLEANTRRLLGVPHGDDRVQVVQFLQEFRIGTHDDPRGKVEKCPRGLLKVTARRSSVSAIKQLGYQCSVFCHDAKHFAMQALVDNQLPSFHGCGKAYLDITKFSTVFKQCNGDDELVEHFCDVIRNVFAHGSERDFGNGRLLMLAHRWSPSPLAPALQLSR